MRIFAVIFIAVFCNTIHIQTALADTTLLEQVLSALRTEKTKRQALQAYHLLTTTQADGQAMGKEFHKQTTVLTRYHNGKPVERTVDGKVQDLKNTKNSSELGFEPNIDDFVWHIVPHVATEIKVIGTPKATAPKEISGITHYCAAETLKLLRSEIESSKPADGVDGLLRIRIEFTTFQGAAMPHRITMDGEGKALVFIPFKIHTVSTMEYK